MGNIPSKHDIGLVFPSKDQKDWMVIFSYNPLGYVKDNESKTIDKDALLKNIKEATEEHNKERRSQSIPTIDAIGWEEAPHYDPKTHNLVWAIAGTSDGHKTINYNTRKLGRHGVISINLVVDPEAFKKAKPEVEKLIENYTYLPGKQYSDFIPGQDKVSEIGLTALIAGGAGAAAVKTGAFGKLLLFLAVALKKLWVFLVVGGAVAIKGLFGGKQTKG